MPRLRENVVRLQECNNGQDRKVYKVVVPGKIVNRNHLQKGDVFVWQDTVEGISIKKIVKSSKWRND